MIYQDKIIFHHSKKQVLKVLESEKASERGVKKRMSDASQVTHHASPNRMKTHKDLDVWNEAMTLAKWIYKLTADFPKEEKCCSV